MSEKNPLPSDLPPSAPVLNDVEGGRVGVSDRVAALRDGPTSVPPSRSGSVSGSMASLPSEEGKKKTRKKGMGLTEGDHVMPEIPKNNMWIVLPSLGLVLFLAALDQTIIATALPTIAEVFDASPSQYSWVATSYQLAMTLLTPVNGRVSDIIGRKPMLYAAIIVFTVFSALCGAAKNMTWLITARAFQGLGGGSIMGLVSIIVSDISPMEKRGAYQGIMGASWGVAAVVGPIIGGALTQKVSWRWCFYINLPTCAIAFVLLVFSLRLNKPEGKTFGQLRHTFDFVGLILIMISGSLLIVGFSFAADYGFNDKVAIALIVVGGVAFFTACINCVFTKRNAVIPARAFRVRTTLLFLIGSSLHAAAFIPANILLPQFFQGVRGADAMQSGIQLLPFAIFVSWSTVVAGQIQSRFRVVRPIVWFGYGAGVLGWGLLYHYFRSTVTLSMQYGLLVVVGIGCGLSLQSPLLIIQAAMPLKEMAAVTAAWTLTRSLGGSVGVSVFTAILNTNLRNRFARIPGDGTDFQVPTSAAGYAAIHGMPDTPLKRAILDAFADSFRPAWLVKMVLFAACLIVTIPTRAYSMKRPRGPVATAEAQSPTAILAEAEGAPTIDSDMYTSRAVREDTTDEDGPPTLAELPEKTKDEQDEGEKMGSTK